MRSTLSHIQSRAENYSIDHPTPHWNGPGLQVLIASSRRYTTCAVVGSGLGEKSVEKTQKFAKLREFFAEYNRDFEHQLLSITENTYHDYVPVQIIFCFIFSKAARAWPEGPTERSVFKIIFVMLAVLWLTFLGGKRKENVT